MKRRKAMLIFTVLFMTVFSVACVFSFGCEPATTIEGMPKFGVVHEHNYEAGDWTWSEDFSACTGTLTCTNGSGTCAARNGGTVSAEVSSEITATCTEDGVTIYSAVYEGEEVSSVEVEMSALGHTYTAESDVVWSWTWDDETGYGAEAFVACDVCGEEAEAEVTVEGPSEGLYGDYTATATMEGQTYTDAKSAEEPDEPYVSDLKIDPGSLMLTLDENGTATGEIVVTVGMSGEAAYDGTLTIDNVDGVSFAQTKNQDGTITVEITATAAVDETTVSVSAGGRSATFTLTVNPYEAPDVHTHVYAEPVWSWSETFDTCTVTWTCTEEGCEEDGRVITETAEISSSEKAATCVTDGQTIYTATATDPYGTVRTDTKSVTTTPATGHSYGTPVWSWSDDYTSAKATFTCTKEGCLEEHEGHTVEVTTEEGEIQQSVSTEPTCTADGSCSYTATVTFGGSSYSAAAGPVAIPATGHTYPDADAVCGVEWTWKTESDGKVTASVTLTCLICGGTETITASVTEGDYTAPGCVVPGSQIYFAEASVESGGTTYTYTSEKSAEIAATGHTEKVYEGSGKRYAAYCETEEKWFVQCGVCEDWYAVDELSGHVLVATNETSFTAALEVGKSANYAMTDKDITEILIPADTIVTLTKYVDIDFNNVTIYGECRATSKIVDTSNEEHGSGTIYNSGIQITGSNVTIKGLTIDGSVYNDDSHASTEYIHTIRINAGDNINIVSCTITGGGHLNNDSSILIQKGTGITIDGCDISGGNKCVYVDTNGDALEVSVEGSTLDAEYPFQIEHEGGTISLRVYDSYIYGRNSLGLGIDELYFEGCTFGYHYVDYDNDTTEDKTGLYFGVFNAYSSATLVNCHFEAISAAGGNNTRDPHFDDYVSRNYTVNGRTDGITITLTGCTFDNTCSALSGTVCDVTAETFMYIVGSKSEAAVFVFDDDEQYVLDKNQPALVLNHSAKVCESGRIYAAYLTTAGGYGVSEDGWYFECGGCGGWFAVSDLAGYVLVATDWTSFSKALDVAKSADHSSDGGVTEIFIPEGYTIELTSYVTIDFDNVTIYGAGADKSGIADAEDRETGESGITNSGIQISGSNVTIKDLTIDGTVFNSDTTHSYIHALEIISGDGITISGCTIIGGGTTNKASSILVESGTNILIDGCTIYGTCKGILSEDNTKELDLTVKNTYIDAEYAIHFDVPNTNTYPVSLKVYDSCLYGRNSLGAGTTTIYFEGCTFGFHYAETALDGSSYDDSYFGVFNTYADAELVACHFKAMPQASGQNKRDSLLLSEGSTNYVVQGRTAGTTIKLTECYFENTNSAWETGWIAVTPETYIYIVGSSCNVDVTFYFEEDGDGWQLDATNMKLVHLDHTVKIYDDGNIYAVYNDADSLWYVQCDVCEDWYAVNELSRYVLVATDVDSFTAALDVARGANYAALDSEITEIFIPKDCSIELTTYVNIDFNNVTIYGADRETSVIVDATSGSYTPSVVNNTGIQISGSNVTIKNLTIDGSVYDGENEHEKTEYVHTVRINGGDNINIISCTITGGGHWNSDSSILILKGSEITIDDCDISGGNKCVFIDSSDSVDVTIKASKLDAEYPIQIEHEAGTVSLKVYDSELYGRNSLGTGIETLYFEGCTFGYHLVDYANDNDGETYVGTYFGAFNAYSDATLENCHFMAIPVGGGENTRDPLVNASRNYAVNGRTSNIVITLIGCTFENTNPDLPEATVDVTSETFMYIVGSKSEAAIFVFEENGEKWQFDTVSQRIVHLGHTAYVYDGGNVYAVYVDVAGGGEEEDYEWCALCGVCGEWFVIETGNVYDFILVADSEASLNAALGLAGANANASEENRTKILVYGEIELTTNLAISCDNVEIYGLGTDRSKIIDSAYDGDPESSSVATSGMEISGKNVTIRDLTINGDALNDVNDSHIYRHALEIKSGAENVTISGCVITGGGVGDSDASVCIMEATGYVRILNCMLSGAENGLVIEHNGDDIDIIVSGGTIDAERAIWVDGGAGVTLEVGDGSVRTSVYGRITLGPDTTAVSFTNCVLGYHVSGELAYGAINTYCDITLDTCTFLSHDEGTNLYDALLYPSGNYAIDIRTEGVTINLYGCSYENTYGVGTKETVQVTCDNLIYLISSRSEEDSVILFEKGGLEYTCRIEEMALEHIHTNWTLTSTTAATDAATGENVYTCTDCGATKTETIPRTTTYVMGVTLSRDYVIVAAGTSGGLEDAPEFTVNLSDETTVTISEYMAGNSGDVTWSSDNVDVAAVGSDGAVTLTGASGVAYITVSFAMDHVSASYVIAVAETIGDDDPILGTWTGEDYVSVTVPIIGTLNLTVDVNVTVTKDGFTLSVKESSYIDVTVWDNVKWYKIAGSYYVVADENTIIPIEYDVESDQLSTSFEFSFTIVINFTVTVEDATLGRYVEETRHAHTPGDETVFSDDGNWYAVCSECGEVCDDALTEGTGYTFYVETAEELTAAVALDGATIVLVSDITAAIEISGTVSIDLAGYTLTGGDAHTITVKAGGGLTIEDTSENGSVINVTRGYSAVYVEAGGKVAIEGGTFAVTKESVGNSARYAATENEKYSVIYSEGTLVIIGGAFETSDSDGGSCVIFAAGGTVEISGGSFTADGASNVVMVAGGNAVVTISGGEFSGTAGAEILETYDGGEGMEASITVSGGQFSELPEGYLDEGYVYEFDEESGSYRIVDTAEYIVNATISDTEITLDLVNGEDQAVLTVEVDTSDGTDYIGHITWTIVSGEDVISIDENGGLSATITVNGMTGEAIVIAVVDGTDYSFGVTVYVEDSEASDEPTYVLKEHTYNFSWDELKTAIKGDSDEDPANSTQLTADYFTGGNSFLTYIGTNSSDKYRTDSNGCIEIKGKGLTVTFEGTGTIEIGFLSTGSGDTNISTLALIDSEGNYLKGEMGSDNSDNLSEIALEDGSGYYYKVVKNSEVTVTFTITNPGTYTIATSIEKTVLEMTGSSDDRATRIKTIKMVDVFEEAVSKDAYSGTVNLTVTFDSDGNRIDVYDAELDDGQKFSFAYSSSGVSGKSTSYDGQNYSYGVNIQYSGKYFTIYVPDGAANVTITAVVYADSGRSVYIGTDLHNYDDGGYIASDESCGSGTLVLTVTDISSGTYYVYGGSSSVYLDALIISYEV